MAMERRNDQMDQTEVYRKNLFLMRVKTVLEELAPEQRVTFHQFDSLFHSKVKKRFEDFFDECRQFSSGDMTIESIVAEIRFFKHSCKIEYDEVGQPVFIIKTVLPKNVAHKSNYAEIAAEIEKRAPNGNEQRIAMNFENSIDLGSGSGSRSSGSGGGASESGTEARAEQKEQSAQRAENDVSATPPRNVGQWQECEKMFAEPYWPGADDNFRCENREKYRNFVEFAAAAPPGDKGYCREVQRRAKDLAVQWFSPYLKWFAHTLYVLRELAKRSPDGFSIDDIERLVDQVFPVHWVDAHALEFGTLETFLTDAETLIERQMLVKCKRSNVYKVNKVIELVGFHLFREKELSYIYQYTSHTGFSKAAYETSEMLKFQSEV
ncbi:unnamed protein product [Caenorhabditis sp. 36 PRJEB53466]|nr:unnamed protein product [Caenorhabditis sp. 36 PRJEB53466]